MQLLFTNNDMLLSRLIRRVTGEPVSHVALAVGDFVIHSRGDRGVTLETRLAFDRINRTLFTIELPDDPTVVPRIHRMERAGYDYPALVYLGIRAVLPSWLRRKLPKANLWQLSGSYICTEFITAALGQPVDSMITPYQLYKKLNG